MKLQNQKASPSIWLIGALIAGAVFAIPAHAVVMYHDFGATSSAEASTGNITTHQIGGSTGGIAQDTSIKNLINYADGSSTGATFQITTVGNAMDGRNAGESRPPAAGTDADPLFNVTGMNMSNGLLLVGNVDNGGEDTMVFTLAGLDSNLLYDLAFYGRRNTNPDGTEQFTLGGVDASSNISSGTTVSSTVTRLDTRSRSSTYGDVIRWFNVDPGANGEITMTIFTDWQDGTANDFASGRNLAYLSAMRLATVPEPSAYALLLGLAALTGVIARRRGR